MTTTLEQSKSISWRCPVCRARGVVAATSSTVDQAIAAAHAGKQPRCDGVPTATEQAE